MFGEFTVTALFVGPNGMRDKVPSSHARDLAKNRIWTRLNSPMSDSERLLRAIAQIIRELPFRGFDQP
jgi:hypothetical protein